MADRVGVLLQVISIVVNDTCYQGSETCNAPAPVPTVL